LDDIIIIIYRRPSLLIFISVAFGYFFLSSSGGGAATSPLTGYVVPAPRTATTCSTRRRTEMEGDGEESEYAPLTKEEIAAFASAGKGTAASGLALKEYEDMPVSAGGEGWPGVDASTRRDTMVVSKGMLTWKNRV
jgi:hypothetical protein